MWPARRSKDRVSERYLVIKHSQKTGSVHGVIIKIMKNINITNYMARQLLFYCLDFEKKEDFKKASKPFKKEHEKLKTFLRYQVIKKLELGT